jgi:putative glycosyltransferase (TIGR04372 family)
LSSVFGRPVAAANQVPLSTVLAFGLNDIATPKLLWSEKESRYLDFREVFESDISNFRFTSLYQDHHIRAVENSPEDVLDLALEMLERIEGPYTYSPEDEALQVRVKSFMREGHFSFGGCNRVGRGFLRKYQHLLEDKPKT